MRNTLESHAPAYQGNNLYDFGNEILVTWYPQRVVHFAGAARSLRELGLGHDYAADISRAWRKHFHLGSQRRASQSKAGILDCWTT
jgi:hypothetical protein